MKRLFPRALVTVAMSSMLTVVSLAGAPAWAAATPMLFQQAGPSGYEAGVAIYDSLTLGGGVNPTGTLTFRLYGPSDPTCTSPVLVSSVGVNGNAYYRSQFYVTNAAGTWRWTAAYSGDANNNPVPPTQCGRPEASVTVIKRTPSLRMSATSLPPAGPTTGTASINGSGPAGPTGTITFGLYGPNDATCAGPAVAGSTVAISGNGSYSSSPAMPLQAGTYRWLGTYSGDANNNPATTYCGDPASAVTVASLTSLLPI